MAAGKQKKAKDENGDDISRWSPARARRRVRREGTRGARGTGDREANPGLLREGEDREAAIDAQGKYGEVPRGAGFRGIWLSRAGDPVPRACTRSPASRNPLRAGSSPRDRGARSPSASPCRPADSRISYQHAAPADRPTTLHAARRIPLPLHQVMLLVGRS